MNFFLIIFIFLLSGLFLFKILINFNKEAQESKFNSQTFPESPDILAGYIIEAHPYEKYYGLLSEDQFERFIINMEKPCESELMILEEKLKQKTFEDELLKRTLELNDKGKKAEQEGRLGDAIKFYEQSISFQYPISFGYNQLSKIYCQNSLVYKETEVLEKAINIFSTDMRYSELVEKWKNRKKILDENIARDSAGL